MTGLTGICNVAYRDVDDLSWRDFIGFTCYVDRMWQLKSEAPQVTWW